MVVFRKTYANGFTLDFEDNSIEDYNCFKFESERLHTFVINELVLVLKPDAPIPDELFVAVKTEESMFASKLDFNIDNRTITVAPAKYFFQPMIKSEAIFIGYTDSIHVIIPLCSSIKVVINANIDEWKHLKEQKMEIINWT